MGFLDFLKGKEEKKTMSLSEINTWLEEQGKNNLSEVLNQIEDIYEKISRTKKEMEKGLNVLENNTLPDNADARLKQMVLSSRESFLRQARVFLEKTPGKPDYDSLEETCKEFTNALKEFTQNTAKKYYINQMLLSKQLSNINKTLRDMERLFNDLKTIKTEKIKKTDKIINNVKAFEDGKKRKGLLKEVLEKLKENKKKIKEKNKSLDKTLEELRKSKEYKEMKELEEALEDVGKNLEKTKNQILVLVSPLEKPLKKIQKSKLSKPALSYLEDPVGSVLKDENLDNLKKVKTFVEESLKTKSIVLEEKMKKKTKERLSKMLNVDKLVRDYKTLKEKEKEVKERLSSSNLDKKESEILNELNTLEKEFLEKEEEISKVLREIEDLDKSLKNTLEKIQEELSSLNTNIVLKDSSKRNAIRE